MASKKNKARAAKEQTTRKFKKKTSILLIEDIEYIDYKDVDLLSRFVSDRAKIRNRRVTGNNLQQQREVANAVKIAREMALIPYAKRVSSQRARPPRGEGRPDRREPRVEAPEAVDISVDVEELTDQVDEAVETDELVEEES